MHWPFRRRHHHHGHHHHGGRHGYDGFAVPVAEAAVIQATELAHGELVVDENCNLWIGCPDGTAKLVTDTVSPENFTGTPCERLQQAINAAALAGVTFQFEAGVIEIDCALTVPAGSHLRGDGTTLKAVASMERGLDIIGDDVLIEDLTVDPNCNARFGIYGEGVQRVEIDDVEVLNWQYGIVFRAGVTRETTDIVIRDTRVHTPCDLIKAIYGVWFWSTKGRPKIERISLENVTACGAPNTAFPQDTNGTADIITLHGVRHFHLDRVYTKDSGEAGLTISRGSGDGVLTAVRVEGADAQGIFLGSGAVDFTLASTAGLAPIETNIVSATLGGVTTITVDNVGSFVVGHKVRLNGIPSGSTQELNSTTYTIGAIAGNVITLRNCDDTDFVNSAGFTPWTAPGGNTRIELALVQFPDCASVVVNEVDGLAMYGELAQGEISPGAMTDGVNTYTVTDVLRTENITVIGARVSNNALNKYNEADRDGDLLTLAGIQMTQTNNVTLVSGLIEGHDIGVAAAASRNYTIDYGVNIDDNVQGVGLFGDEYPTFAYDSKSGITRMTGGRTAAWGSNSGDPDDWHGEITREQSGIPREIYNYRAPALLVGRADTLGIVVQVEYGDTITGATQLQGGIGVHGAIDGSAYFQGTLRPGAFTLPYADRTNPSHPVASSVAVGEQVYCPDHPSGAGWMYRVGAHTNTAMWRYISTVVA